MADDFAAAFASLRPVLAKHAKRLTVKADNSNEYTLLTRSPSPFKQHKGQPLFFGSIRIGKAYVSFHLLPIYMCPELAKKLSPELKKRMQGKACFNFKTSPESKIVTELKLLTEAAFKKWDENQWI
jgi:hypothetical protein